MKELNFKRILDNLLTAENQNLDGRLFCLLSYEITRRAYDLSFADWLNSFYMCDRYGSRFVCPEIAQGKSEQGELSDGFQSFVTVASRSIYSLLDTKLKCIDSNLSVAKGILELATIRVVTLASSGYVDRQTLSLGSPKARKIIETCAAPLVLPPSPPLETPTIRW